ncbi:hypothetical protein TWF696_009736 [Orbilia brochopaga]|uniref:Mid2 domain-containing protein n=1 Tax=Orbilia brochopaga TaxID=3140254 RepID=A0AAV9UGA8_9PEZI
MARLYPASTRTICTILALSFTLFTSTTNAQSETAIVSVISDADYKTARPCIQTCIWYNGALGRGGNSGFQDVGKALGCGQMPINACYCSDRLTATATSYFSQCISSLCTAITDPADLSSALSIYGRYCSTNQVAAAVTSNGDVGAGVGAGDTSSGGSTSGSGTRNTAGQTAPAATSGSSNGGSSSNSAAAKSNPGSNSETTSPESSSSGLSTTSKIALGVGLGIGIPVLILLSAVLFLLLRRGRTMDQTNVGGIETTQTH